MNVEIAICTFNRSRLLGKTLSRLAKIDRDACDSLKVIVVDNNCTDETSEVVAQHAGQIDIVPLHESRQGQVFSRNTAIEATQGDLLIWADDDVVVSDNWLTGYVAAAKTQMQYSFWGGPIVPVFEQSQPKWIADNWDKLCGCFAERRLGDEPFDFTTECLPYGANFAIRTSLQKQYPFSEQLGRTAQVVMGEDELTLFRNLLQDRHKGHWLPEAAVDHLIDSTRTTTDYIGNYFRGQGRALVFKGLAWTDSVDELKKEATHELACFNRKRRLSKSEVWLSHLIRGSLAAGQVEAMANNS